MAKSEDTLKTRKIRFSKRRSRMLAKDAMTLLKDVNSIANLSLHSSTCLAITYDIRNLSLQMIESALKEVGFVMDDGLLPRIKRAVCAYCEDAEKERLGINHEHGTHEDLVQMCEKLVHDPRPNDWRHYS